MKFKDKLVKLKACSSAVDWVGDRDAKAAWEECKRGDWMMWLINASNPKITLDTRKKLVLCACDIAETALKYLPKDEKRPAEALRIARAWAKGEKISIEEVKTAANAACAAYVAANAAYSAYSAYYAAYSAVSAAYSASAAYYAASAAYSDNADIVRKYFPKPPKI